MRKYLALMGTLLLIAIGGGLASAWADQGPGPEGRVSIQARAQAGPPGGEFKEVPGVGLARRSAQWPGMLEIKNGDGTISTSHGPDSTVLATEPGLSAPDGGQGSAAEPKPVWCQSNLTEPHFRILYGYPGNQSSRLSAVTDGIRADVRKANGIIHQAAQETSSSWTAKLRVRCNADDQIAVTAFKAEGVGSGEDNFTKIKNAAKDDGFNDANVNYVIFWDSPIANKCGQGDLYQDSRRVAGNINNTGKKYAAVYGENCWTGRVVLHEITHTMGGVQYDAPRSTRFGHCHDEQDVMCYADGASDGQPSDMTTPCPSVERYDCGHNDYFDAGTSSGYLATHWNIGWSGNKFLRFVQE